MNTDPDGTMLEIDGRTALRFERRLDHPVERVWRALTETDELARWHPSPFRLEQPRAGGALRYVEPWPEQGIVDTELVEYEPPRLLVHPWGPDLLRWELRPAGDGCLLVLVHSFDDRFKAARDGAGWHVCLAGLAAVLDGTATENHDDRNPRAWPELNRAYERRFGITPEQATPPPPGQMTES